MPSGRSVVIVVGAVVAAGAALWQRRAGARSLGLEIPTPVRVQDVLERGRARAHETYGSAAWLTRVAAPAVDLRGVAHVSERVITLDYQARPAHVGEFCIRYVDAGSGWARDEAGDCGSGALEPRCRVAEVMQRAARDRPAGAALADVTLSEAADGEGLWHVRWHGAAAAVVVADGDCAPP